jgi:hypothetical protein
VDGFHHRRPALARQHLAQIADLIAGPVEDHQHDGWQIREQQLQEHANLWQLASGGADGDDVSMGAGVGHAQAYHDRTKTPESSRSSHQTDHHPGACKRWRLAAFLLLGRCRRELAGVAHVVPGGRDPAIGALHMRDAELIDVAVKGISDAAHVPSDAKSS